MPMRSASMRETSYSRSIRRRQRGNAAATVAGSQHQLSPNSAVTGDSLSVTNMQATSIEEVPAPVEAAANGNGHN